MTTNSNQAVAVYEQPQAAVMIGNAQHVANLCRDIVARTTVRIGKTKHVRCEGWMAIAAAHGCIPSSGNVVKVDTGYVAKGYIRRISDGVELSEAEGFVGLDEPEWARKPEYASRAMAQTRAIGRACRASFAHIIIMIDSELSVTPAEEVPAGGFEAAQPVAPKTAPARTIAPKPSAAPAAQVDASQLVGFIKYVKATETKKPGTFRYGILITASENGEGPGTWVNTFEKTIGEAAQQNTGAHVAVTYSESKYGKDVVKFDLREAPTAAVPAPEPVAAAATNEDDVPF